MAATDLREFLRNAVVDRDIVDRFLDTDALKWSQHDPELGWVLHNSAMRDGVDGSRSVYRYEREGHRKLIAYADRPCRINTYGDSFTQCHQTSDGETWQEYLAAHIGEPIRNFGVGGHGVYQAYRRMLRHETAAETSASHVILNVWFDDHFRSIVPMFFLRFIPAARHIHRVDADGVLSGCLCPWDHARIDEDTGDLVELPNTHPTAQSLYRLCDPDDVYETFKDDLATQLLITMQTGRIADEGRLRALADTLGVGVDLSDESSAQASAKELNLQWGMRSSMRIVEKVRAFADEHGKQLMVLLSYGTGEVQAACEGAPRIDRPFVDYLRSQGITFSDSLAKHALDFKAFNLSPADYLARYYIGHYSPQGNHFFAFCVKDDIVAWLDPKPFAYREAPLPRDEMFAQIWS